MAVQDYLTLSHLRKVVAAITQRIVGVENSVSNVENDVSDINGAIEELRNDKEVFVITMSYASVENYTLSATYEEIATAIRNGKTCCVTATLSGGSLYYIGEGSISEIFFENTDYLLAVNTNDTVTVVSRHIWIDNNSNKWVITPFENFNLLSDVYCNLNASIYNPTIEDYDYSNIQILTERRKKYIYYIDPKTSDTIIFTNTDSSVNEWTKTVKPTPYTINITDRNSATTLVSDKSPSEISDVYYSEKPVFAFIDASTVPTGQYQLSDIIDSPTESAVVFNNGFCEIKVTETQIPAAVAEIGGKYSCEYTYIGIPNDIDSAIDGQILTYDDTNSMWVNSDLPSIPTASSTTPSSDGTGAVGVSTAYARADHVHPKITQSLSISSNVITLTGSDGTTSSVTLPVYNGGVSS